MNNSRRKEIAEISDKLRELREELLNVAAQIDEVRNDERESFDSMPASLKAIEQAEIILGNVDTLDKANDYINSALVDISDAWSALTHAGAK